MWMDHITFALHEMDALDGYLHAVGLNRRPVEPLFDGTQRSVILLSEGFVELLTVSDRRAARQLTLGQALIRFLTGGEGIFRVVVGVPDLDAFMRTRRILGAQYWPPIDEEITGIAAGPVPIRLTQMDLMLPWVLAYRGARPTRHLEGPRFSAVEVQSADPRTTASQYRIALGCDIDEEEPPGGSPRMGLENAVLRFQPGASPGFSSLVIEGKTASLALRAEGGQVSGTLIDR